MSFEKNSTCCDDCVVLTCTRSTTFGYSSAVEVSTGLEISMFDFHNSVVVLDFLLLDKSVDGRVLDIGWDSVAHESEPSKGNIVIAYLDSLRSIVEPHTGCESIDWFASDGHRLAHTAVFEVYVTGFAIDVVLSEDQARDIDGVLKEA